MELDDLWPAITNKANDFYLHAFNRLGNLKSRSVSVLSSIPLHVQDPWIAGGSIVFVNLVAYQISAFIAHRLHKNAKALKLLTTQASELLAVSLGISTIVASIVVFVNWTKPPIHPFLIAAISITTLISRTKLPQLFSQGNEL